MKLRAGLCLLKLANAKVYDKAMSWELFESVASVCQVDLDHRAPRLRYRSRHSRDCIAEFLGRRLPSP
jgi:hypothetical protein